MDKHRNDGLPPSALDKFRVVTNSFSSQKEAAERSGIPIATLQRVLAGTSPLTLDRVAKMALAARIGADEIIGPGYLVSDVADALMESEEDTERDGIRLPALSAKAAAGDGSVIWGPELRDSPFRFAADWLRQKFGSIPSLRLVQIHGDSQIPDLSDGDWVIVDTAKNRVENGLAVVRLDDCLMIKRLQREGHFLQMISRNPIYGPIVLDLSKESDRLQVVGHAVFSMRAVW